MIFWSFTTIVKPILTYASLAWWTKVKQRKAAAELNSVHWSRKHQNMFYVNAQHSAGVGYKYWEGDNAQQEEANKEETAARQEQRHTPKFEIVAAAASTCCSLGLLPLK
ncbi:hypothetical protein ACLKA7_015214 [Drosophila subpalustris]